MKDLKQFIKKHKKVISIVTIVLLILFLIIFVVFFVLQDSEEAESNSEDLQTESFGFESINFENTPPSKSEIEADREKVTPVPDDQPIPIISTGSNAGYEFLREPDRARWYADNGAADDFFEIVLAEDISNNILQTSFDDTSEQGVYKGRWSYLGYYVLFSKVENTDSQAIIDDSDPNISNIWVLDVKSGEIRQVVDIAGETNVDYVTNGEQIAFVTKNTVEIVDLDGTNRKVVYEFDEFDNRSEQTYVPTMRMSSFDEFEVNIKKPTFFADGAEETLKFNFKGERL